LTEATLRFPSQGDGRESNSSAQIQLAEHNAQKAFIDVCVGCEHKRDLSAVAP
jgi:hypothetical protein